ncbi:hypothetical protein HYPSUDRAFT_288553 [Hypholoma sublateritium FD-334 SS-4]|uniref:Uncharacterized protein n=1 Tax=Hypholoma sublateritium (strain FD-334 SS-4) TaxID=945553 RepID=A0A0D2NBI9_HYPSF|nr:hypothetical protein HYPSUDRAFT_288553 [Hypholoma sublateritium FD-334 SS-4]
MHTPVFPHAIHPPLVSCCRIRAPTLSYATGRFLVHIASALPGRYRSRRAARNVHYARTACVSYTGCVRCRASLYARSRAHENAATSVSAIPLSHIFSGHYTPPSPSPLPRPIFQTGYAQAHASRA